MRAVGLFATIAHDNAWSIRERMPDGTETSPLAQGKAESGREAVRQASMTMRQLGIARRALSR